jgi:hypothetical protein
MHAGRFCAERRSVALLRQSLGYEVGRLLDDLISVPGNFTNTDRELLSLQLFKDPSNLVLFEADWRWLKFIQQASSDQGTSARAGKRS